MPTVEVTSNPLTASTRLKAALRLTRWLAAHGSHASHVVVAFRAAEPMTYFAGGMPLDMYGDGGSGREDKRAQWASIVCHIHPERDHAYMTELAQEVKEALGLTEDSGHCLVRFEPTRPDLVFYLESESMTSNGLKPAERRKGPRYADH